MTFGAFSDIRWHSVTFSDIRCLSSSRPLLSCYLLALILPVICNSNDDRFHGADCEIDAESRHICMICIPSLRKVLWSWGLVLAVERVEMMPLPAMDCANCCQHAYQFLAFDIIACCRQEDFGLKILSVQFDLVVECRISDTLVFECAWLQVHSCIL